MEILIDTNVFIDMFQKRQPFTDFATAVITSCVNGQNTGFVSSHSLSDMFYILRKDFSATERKELIRFICTYFTVICEQKEDFLAAVDNSLSLDMEDGLQMQCAKKHNLDYIVTRNIKDFAESYIPAIHPNDFLEMYGNWID